MKLTTTPAWQALAAHADTLRQQHLRDLFAADSERFARLSLHHDGLLLDYSKQRVTAETMALLRQLADTADFTGWRQKLLRRCGDQPHRRAQRAPHGLAGRRAGPAGSTCRTGPPADVLR
jgi:glucose-6-phosphate isomerase